MEKKIRKIAAPLLMIVLMVGGGTILYKKMTSFTGPTKQEEAAQQDKENAINGQWQASDDLVCDVWRDGADIFHASITLTQGADTVTFWECSGPWSDDLNGFAYTDGVKMTNVYAADGEISSETAYEEGKGSVYLKDGKVYWDDKEEHTAKGKSFTYVGEY